MTAQILSALARGFSSNQIVQYILRQFPQHANRINQLVRMGYEGSTILKILTQGTRGDNSNPDEFLTESEQIDKRNIARKRKIGASVIGAVGTAGAVGAGLYQYAKSNQAIRPSQILPAQQQARGIPYQQPRTLQARVSPQNPNPQAPQPQNLVPPQVLNQRTRGLPSPKIPSGQSPKPFTQAPISPLPEQTLMPSIKPNLPSVIQRDPIRNLEIAKNIGEDKRIVNLLQGGLDVSTIAGTLRSILPKQKVQVLEQAEGGLEQLIQDVSDIIQNQSYAPRQKQNQITEQITPSNEIISEQQEGQQQLQKIEPVLEKEPIETSEIRENDIVITPSGKKGKIQKIKDKIANVAFENRVGGYDVSSLKKLNQVKIPKEKSFAIPTYKYDDESEKEFEDRQVMHGAIKKAAKAITEGKSFLDFPITKEALKAQGGYSVAEDVLRFMAGIPNVYDPLLDEEEKQELTDMLLESGEMSTHGLRPSKGERNIHGAQLEQNMVYNLLLSVEPKLSKIKLGKVKGSRIKGQKMTTTDFRRFLTHGVYSILSGKNITTELADKISKISKAVSYTDTLIEALKQGKQREQEKEMERLMDDEYFFSLFTEEVEELARKYR